MGNNQSSQQAPRHNYDGPLFGGHYAGDFSIRRERIDYNKTLPPTPPVKSVTFGANPPQWKFYKNRPSDENTYNTRYCSGSPQQQQQQYRQEPSPPPAYGMWQDNKGFTGRN